MYGTTSVRWIVHTLTQEKRRVNTDPFLHRIVLPQVTEDLCIAPRCCYSSSLLFQVAVIKFDNLALKVLMDCHGFCLL